ncbi:transposase [Microvirga massiliensis]|uniref:transposase n=1 Tax=Microvirga massiliensis TaxID=1033741 RepID=UPI00093F6AF4
MGPLDASYGNDTQLRTGVSALGLSYVAGIQTNTSVWAPGTVPRPPNLIRRDAEHRPVSMKVLASEPAGGRRHGQHGPPELEHTAAESPQDHGSFVQCDLVLR